MSKPVLSVDFDGVIHQYTTKWQGADVIPDPPVPEALEFLEEACIAGFDVHIFSTRNAQDGGIKAMQDWMIHWWNSELQPETDKDKAIIEGFVRLQLKWPTTKPPAQVMIDDRAFRFEGTWPSISELKLFKPWNKK